MGIINYIGNNDSVEDKLVNYLKTKGYQFLHYDVRSYPIVPYLLILEPYKLVDDYYHIHKVWKTYFEANEKYENLRLMVAGFAENENHPNYLNLFNLNSNIEDILKNAKTIKESWEMPLGYMDIRVRLRKYFKGHDRVSLYQKLNYLQFSVDNINSAISGKIKRNYEDAERRILPMARRQYKEFQDRWKNYNHFFLCCPFFKEHNTISRLITEIRPYFEKPNPDAALFQELRCFENIQLIRSNLKKMDKYVRPEIDR